VTNILNTEQAHRDDILLYLANNLAKSSKILDLGCGNGEDSIRLMELGFDVYSLDSTEINMGNFKHIGPRCLH
jgi:2-polyprenyl-3-methyl-5-hydroxy-6-metoxy-1,4-benzoquinol methylase